MKKRKKNREKTQKIILNSKGENGNFHINFKEEMKTEQVTCKFLITSFTMKRSEFVSEHQFKTVHTQQYKHMHIMKTALTIAKRLSHPQPIKMGKRNFGLIGIPREIN